MLHYHKIQAGMLLIIATIEVYTKESAMNSMLILTLTGDKNKTTTKVLEEYTNGLKDHGDAKILESEDTTLLTGVWNMTSQGLI